MKTAYLGRKYNDFDYIKALKQSPFGLNIKPEKNIIKKTADLLEHGKVVGWFQGRSEFGPRALGNRSILAHPGLKNIKKIINTKIKKREFFRPFAPVIIENKINDFFLEKMKDPFMLFNFTVKNDVVDQISEVIHVDGSSRVQTLNRNQNKLLFDLLKEFEKRTKLPLLLNTSFNIDNEPIVESPRDALRTFFMTDIDSLVLGPYIIDKNNLDTRTINRIKKIIGSEPIDYLKSGHSNRRKGYYREAIFFYEKALKVSTYKDEHSIFFYLSQCYLSVKNYKKAISYGLKAIKLKSCDFGPYLVVSKSYLKIKLIKKATYVIKKGIKNNRHQNQGYLELALLYNQIGNKKELKKILDNNKKIKGQFIAGILN